MEIRTSRGKAFLQGKLENEVGDKAGYQET